MGLNVEQWNQQRLRVERELRELKAVRDESHQPRWDSDLGLRFAQLRLLATFLYINRARARGRQHLQGEDGVEREEAALARANDMLRAWPSVARLLEVAAPAEAA